MRGYRAGVLLTAFLLGGCAVADRGKMVVEGAPAPPKYRNAMAVRNVTGECNFSAAGIKPLICIDTILSNKEMKEGLEKSLAASGYLATGTAKYYVDMNVEDIRSSIGMDMEVSTDVTYTLTDGTSAKTIPIKAKATAKFSEAALGATRDKIATIYSLRENFKQFLASLP